MPAANVAPTIGGTPPTSGVVGTPYSFTATATDANSDTLSFSARNLPTWLVLDARTGRLSGTPAAAGTASGIVVTVADASLSASLPAFNIVVAAAPAPPAPGAAQYNGFTYSLPAVRPFISLAHYAQVSRTSPEFLRLQAQVDDAVTITNNLAPSATYAQLVAALNSAHYGYSSTDSVILYRLTGDAKYIQQAIRMVDLFVTSEQAKIGAGSAPTIAGDSYLEIGFYMEQLALAYDSGYALLSGAQRAAWSAYAEQALHNLWNPTTASWGGVARTWSGWSIQDPGNNYFYSFLKATQLWALSAQSTTWIQFLQTQKYTLLVPFFAQLEGGGSREGTGYGTALGNLFEDYAYWQQSTSEDLAGYSNHARNTIDYWIHATVPTFDYFASLGDQSRSSIPIMFDYQRKLVATAVTLAPASAQASRGTWWLKRARVTDGGSSYVTGRMRYNYNYRYDLLSAAATETAPTALVYDAVGTGALFARSNWSTTASWMHTNAGPYDQSHAHQDQGSFSFYKNGWLTLTSNAWSSSGINQGVDVHNVIRFMSAGSAIAQTNSTSSKTVNDTGTELRIQETLTPAYARSGGRVTGWQRDLTYRRDADSLAVHDVCTVTASTAPIWQLHTPVLPVRQSDGSYVAGNLRISIAVPNAPVVSIVNMHSLSGEFSSGYRLEIAASPGGCEFNVTLQAL